MARQKQQHRLGISVQLLLSVPLLFMSSVACVGTPSPLAPALRGSVGAPHRGVLTDARELPVRGDGFQRFRPYSSNYWGNPRLVTALEEAAATVARRFPGGPPLVVGDLSARYGGKIPRHNSHRNGRDVDLLWYFTTPEGPPVVAPGFIHVGADGLAVVDGRYFMLDVPRQWLLIKTLLRSEHVDVQFLFVSREVESLITQYALARERDHELVWRAITVMLEPGDSAPHNDHVHVRIACTPEEEVTGCEGGGPYWQWLPEPLTLNPLKPAVLSHISADDPLQVFEPPKAAPSDASRDGA